MELICVNGWDIVNIWMAQLYDADGLIWRGYFWGAGGFCICGLIVQFTIKLVLRRVTRVSKHVLREYLDLGLDLDAQQVFRFEVNSKGR
jgi:hypothetical protein